MDHFHYHNGQLFCEGVDLDHLARQHGTPLYVYSKATLTHHYDALHQAFSALDPVICYAIKSCGNLHLCRLLAQRGAGMDVVSGGELFRAKEAGADMKKVVYAGVGKTDEEICAALEAKIGYFNIESEAEFENIAAIAKRLNVKANAALRVNPDVDPKTHAKTSTGKKESKFGVDIERARRFFARYGKDAHLRLCALHLHIGSPVYQVQPYVDAITKALQLIAELRGEGFTISALDIGGGYGADYESDQTPDYAAYAREIVPLLLPFRQAGGVVILEPGRTIAANAGLLLTRVQYIKMGGRKKFIIIDSGMHHLIRPTLYDSFHFIWPTNVAPMHAPVKRAKVMELPGLETADVVGPICESGDYLAKDRLLPPVSRGDLLAVFTAGAYGMVMASNYNAMPRPAEVLIDGDQALVIRRRETYEDLVAAER
jgi:diaminopimelate decarboxylase